MLLADDYFQIAHDLEGAPRLTGRSVGLGLAGALLAELVDAGALSVDGDALYPVEGPLPADGLAHMTLDRVASEPEHRLVRTWLEFLARDAGEQVAARLVRRRSWTRVESRRLGRTRVEHVPVDPNRAGWPEARLWTAAHHGRTFTDADRVLAGLVTGTGLSWLVFRNAGTHVTDHVALEASKLSAPLRDLVAQVAATVGDAVLTHRT